MYSEFDLKMPATLDEALTFLADGPDRVALAGGTNLMLDLRARTARPECVVSLGDIDGLRFIDVTGARITLGGRTTVSDILRSAEIPEFGPALIDAAKGFAGQMVRNAATVGGNIACGSPAADLVPPLMSLGAELTLAGPAGTRRIKLADYFTGYKKDCRQHDEIITEIGWDRPPADSFNRFYKLARRHGDAITVTGVAVLLATQENKCSHVRIALGAVAPSVMRAREAERMLHGKILTPELISAAAKQASRECHPIDDVRASAQYRIHTVTVLVRRLLAQGREKTAGQGD